MLLDHLLACVIVVCVAVVVEGSTNSVVETTTSDSIVIRRKSNRMSSGGGRLSLMNNRFSRRPRKKNMDPDQLLEILGSYYDPDWMSVEEPPAHREPDKGATYLVPKQQDRELVRQLANLSSEMTLITGQLVDPGFVKAMEKWLLKKASCPVRYAWEDIGSLFWPRYIRRGECAGTCSWPPGMHCVPHATAQLHVLRWQCKVPKGGGRGRRKTLKNPHHKREWPKNISAGEQTPNLRCSWVRVPYPITSECLCTC